MRIDRDVRAVILKSDVQGIFCAGADLKERAKMKEEEVGPLVTRARRMFSDVSTLPVPVITALDGGAFGGGMELALATDIRIAGIMNVCICTTCARFMLFFGLVPNCFMGCRLVW